MTIPTMRRERAEVASELDRLFVGQVMHRGVLTAPLHAPLTKVARMMARYRMHSVVALGEREDGSRVWGLIPAAEVVRIAATQDLGDRTAGGSAISEVITVEPADSLRDAAELMARHDVTHVIVVDPVSDRPLGVLSTLDIVQALAGDLPRTARGGYHVAQLMTVNVLTVGPDTPLKEVARLLFEHGISGVPVVEDGRLLGIVSEADILAKERGPAARRTGLRTWVGRRQRRADAERLDARTAGEAMTAPAITVGSWHTAAEAAAIMLERGVHRLPVLKDGKLVGIVTRGDLVSAFSRLDKEIEQDIREDVMLRSFWMAPGEVDVTVRDGEVKLTGTVESSLVLELLPEAVQRVPGVVGVRSHLTARVTTEPKPRFERFVPPY